MPVSHPKVNTVAPWTQADLDAAIAAGQVPAGTTLAGFVLSTDWNSNHTVSVTVSEISATGTPSASTYLRGDGAWAPGDGTGTVTTTGTPIAGQLAKFSSPTAITTAVAGTDYQPAGNYATGGGTATGTNTGDQVVPSNKTATANQFLTAYNSSTGAFTGTQPASTNLSDVAALATLTGPQAITNKDLTGAGNAFPTFNQNTTGSAAKWTTARALAGNSVDGSAAVPFANKFIVQGTADAGLTGAQFLGALGTGLLKNTASTGVLSLAVAGTDYGLGTVTSVAATNTQGVTTNVTNSTTTPSIAIGLGAITPTSVTAPLTGTIGATTANTGAFTTVSATGAITSTKAYSNTAANNFIAAANIPSFGLQATSAGTFGMFVNYSAGNVTDFLVGVGSAAPSTTAASIDHSTGGWKIPSLLVANLPNVQITSSTAGIDGKTVAGTLAYTNSTGKTLIVNGATIRCTAASSITNGPTVAIGTTNGGTDIFAAQAINALTTNSKMFWFTRAGMSVIVPNGGTVYVNVTAAATGTSQTIAADIEGYFV